MYSYFINKEGTTELESTMKHDYPKLDVKPNLGCSPKKDI